MLAFSGSGSDAMLFQFFDTVSLMPLNVVSSVKHLSLASLPGLQLTQERTHRRWGLDDNLVLRDLSVGASLVMVEHSPRSSSKKLSQFVERSLKVSGLAS